jgi:hypothetical protein
MIDKNSYRLKCRMLAHIIAKSKMAPEAIPGFLSKQKWFMVIQGITNNKNAPISQSGAFLSFGEDWCNHCMQEELVKTGIYDPVESETFEVKLHDNITVS